MQSDAKVAVVMDIPYKTPLQSFTSTIEKMQSDLGSWHVHTCTGAHIIAACLYRVNEHAWTRNFVEICAYVCYRHIPTLRDAPPRQKFFTFG